MFIICVVSLDLSAQNVGIGTASPTQKLDVVGNVKVSGAIMPGGVAGTTGQVLVSNGAGNAATWESLTTTGNSKFYVSLSLNNNTTPRGVYSVTSGASQSDSIDLSQVFYNIGPDFPLMQPLGTSSNSFISGYRISD